MDTAGSIFGGELLPAKLSRPRLKGVCPRKRFFEALSDIGDAGAVWISGPAGSGKTTAINSFLQDRGLPCLWYSLDAGDSDIASFFYYLRGAVKAQAPAGVMLPPLLTPDYFPNLSVFANRFFEKAFALLPAPFALVFDDYQEIPDASPLHEVICSAISHSPDGTRLYVASREEPPSELARPWANGNLYLLGWRHLRLEPAETRDIAQETIRTNLSDEVVADLHKKTDGWVAGLMLLLRRGELERIEPQLLSRHTPGEIFDYFGGEIFDKLPPGVQEEMLQFAFLPTITVETAKTITGTEGAEDLLYRLHRGNTFLNRLVGTEICYRFHPLLRDFLQMRARRTLTPTALGDLKSRSAAVLVEEGDYKEGIRLYVDAGELDKAIELILSQAPALAEQGRFRTLETFIVSLPESLQDDSAWLVYWRTACRLPYAVRKGNELPRTGTLREGFVKAFTRFERNEDRVGCYLALAGILESISIERDNFGLLDPWIAKWDEMETNWGLVQDQSVMLWLTPAVICALMMRQPTHPRLSEWMEKGQEILRTIPHAAAGIRIFLPLTMLYIFQGKLAEAGTLITVFREMVNENSSPFGTLVFHGVEAFHCLMEGRFDECIRIADASSEIETHFDMHYMYPHVQGAAGAMSLGRIELAEDLMSRTAPFLTEYSNWDMGLYHVNSGWIALVKKEDALAKCHASKALKTGSLAGNPLTLPAIHLLCAICAHRHNEAEAADFHFETALEMTRKFHTPQVEFGCHLTRAEWAMEGENPDRLESALSDGFELGRRNRYVTAYFWLPDVMAELCVAALDREIEVDYARFLVKQRRLVPGTPPRHLQNWPWFLKIRAFGGFYVEIDDRPLVFTGKAQQRPLSILKYLMAAGGHRISDAKIQDDLWPDSDGDRAASAFKTALHRLRKLLKDGEAIRLTDGSLSLNPSYCWTDVDCFEDLRREADDLLANRDPSAEAVVDLFDRLLVHYRGPFLPNEETPWAIQARQEFTARFVELVLRCALAVRDRGDTGTAVEMLRKADHVAPWEEAVYYHMMKLLYDRGKTDEAVTLFEPYRRHLSTGTGQTPSSRIRLLYQTLKNNESA